MIDWVHDACHEWRHQMRKMRHDSGYPPRSLLGKLIDEGLGASSSQFYQHLPEVLTGQALDVSKAVRKMAETHQFELPCIVLMAHYLFAGTAAGKARILRLDMPTWWRHLHSAHCYIAAVIPVPRETKVLQHEVA